MVSVNKKICFTDDLLSIENKKANGPSLRLSPVFLPHFLALEWINEFSRSSKTNFYIKFGYSEKATKFEKNHPLKI